ncbi:hypothetical protein TNCV_238721 [Trichonephila clavipes]|nr:hypothetical protein TNCV_238721 [Trichonephila clavipes]
MEIVDPLNRQFVSKALERAEDAFLTYWTNVEKIAYCSSVWRTQPANKVDPSCSPDGRKLLAMLMAMAAKDLLFEHHYQ